MEQLNVTTMQVDTGPLSVTWPVDYKAYSNVSKEQIMGRNPIASSLNHSVRVLLAGTSANGPRNAMIKPAVCDQADVS